MMHFSNGWKAGRYALVASLALWYMPWVPGAIRSVATADEKEKDKVEQTIYDFTVKDIDGKDVSLADYRGKVCLVVNMASL